MERRILTVRWYCVQNYLWHANHCTILNQIVVRIELFTYYHWARCTVVTGLEMCVWCSMADEAYGLLTLSQVTSSPLEYIGPVSQQDHRSGPVRNQAERYRLLQCESSLNAQFSSQRSRNLTNYTSTNTNTETSLFSMWLQTKHWLGVPASVYRDQGCLQHLRRPIWGQVGHTPAIDVKIWDTMLSFMLFPAIFEEGIYLVEECTSCSSNPATRKHNLLIFNVIFNGFS